MKETQYYHLPQWDPSDRVLRENFNSNNKKIDDALHQMQQSISANNDKIDQGLHQMAQTPNLVKLKTFTTSSKITGTSVFDMNVSDINWGQWQWVYMDFRLKGHGHIYLYANSDRDDAYSTMYSASGNIKSLAGAIGCDYYGKAIRRIEFLTFCNVDQTIETVCAYTGTTGYSRNYTYANLRTLHLMPNSESYYIEPGSTITFWGLR